MTISFTVISFIFLQLNAFSKDIDELKERERERARKSKKERERERERKREKSG